jgi:4-hydroxybenzoate polyprenyltransferase
MFGEVKKWLEFVKFSHTVFALPFALASMLIAARDNRGWPGARVFLLILVAMACARTCAMAFNRIVDRKFDKDNPRTSLRHLPAGGISLMSAWTLWGVSAVGLVAASYFLNPICFYLSPVALIVVCSYSLTKRFTDFTHVFLGIAIALAPVGAWLAVRGNFDFMPIREGFLVPLLLAVAVVFWLIGFDVIYAIQDYEFDRKHGLHSLVVRWGPKNALRAAFLSHTIMLLLLGVLGLLCGFTVAYFIGMLLVMAAVLFEHFLARIRKLNWVQNAFFRLNAIISIIFVVMTFAEIGGGGFGLYK